MKKDSDYNDLISWDVILGSPKKGGSWSGTDFDGI